MNNKGRTFKTATHEQIKQIEEEHGIKLSAIQKILLSLRGPITNPLDALYGTVRIFVIKQRLEKSDKQIADMLEIDEGDEILHREVIVHKNGRPLVYGLSYIPTARCNDAILNQLLEEKTTTGAIIAENNIETLRKFNRISVEEPSALLKELFKTDEKMLSREYVMIQHGKIRMWTKEAYPLSSFTEL